MKLEYVYVHRKIVYGILHHGKTLQLSWFMSRSVLRGALLTRKLYCYTLDCLVNSPRYKC